jgi:hypothetical protein
VTIDALQLRFLDVDLMGNLHVMSFFLLLLSHMPVTTKAIVIHLFIGVKISGKQFSWSRMTIHAGNADRMNSRA